METVKRDTVLEGDKIWEEISKMQISFAGLPQQNVEKYFKKKTTMGESVLIQRLSAASVLDQILDEGLNSWTDRNGSTHYEDRYVVKKVKEGVLEVSRAEKEEE
jgi:hypothetical protein